MSDVTKNLTACEEFMELVTVAHVISAAIHSEGVRDIKELSTKILSCDDQLAAVTSIVKTLCSQKVCVAFSTVSKRNTGTTDHVLEYAKETMSLGLLLLEFKDAIREGDGTRILRCWKYFFIIFRATRHKNYCIEAFNLFMQYYYTLPPRYAEQMLWGRFINSEGGQGRNISADLHMEHLNRIVKDAVGHLGANKTPQAIMRASKALGALKEILVHFDKSNKVWSFGNHTRRSDTEDLVKVITELTQSEVFKYICGRRHSTFPSMHCNKLLKVNQRKLDLWMKKRILELLNVSPLSR